MPSYAGQISEVQIGSGLYQIKDAVARQTLAGGMHFKGVYDSLPAVAGFENGDVIAVGPKEYVCYEGEWIEFGDMSDLSQYVLKSYEHTYQPAGEVSAPGFTGTTATLSHDLTKASTTISTQYQPAGSISEPVFTGATATIKSTITYQPEGDISAASFTGTTATINAETEYQPAGTVSAPTFTGTTATLDFSSSYQPAGTVSQPTFTGDTATLSHNLTKAETTLSTSYQPAGTIDVAISDHVGTLTTVPAVATATIYVAANSETLVLPSIVAINGHDAVTAVASIDAHTVTTKTFTGTTATIEMTTSAFVTGVADHTITPEGTVSQPTFTGTTATIGGEASYQPAGTISAPTFTGTTASLTATAQYQPAGTIGALTFTGTTATFTINADYTPEGTISAPTFTGTTATIAITTSDFVTGIADHTYQPAGTNAAPTFTGTTATLGHNA